MLTLSILYTPTPLKQSTAPQRIQLGTKITQGLGAGSRPEIGRAAAEETIDSLAKQLEGAHMVFIAAGMGGGTGTGAAPVIAKAARDMGILTLILGEESAVSMWSRLR